MSNPCRLCGRKTKRTEMTKRQLQSSKAWCHREIEKIEEELEKRD